ncbi:B3 domain-containing protein [Acorus calamus]|uniref:B3 domain-containing protein n=1 Tax=Acorus calamus TaxID=4465 RepID=A0AAV9FL60_ACOCL|nr:B3 domain-containing protein [Acorus calamus]
MVAEKRSSYEEIRQRTIEENKKKLDELNLSLLTKSLRETASPKPYPVKQVKKRKIDVGSESFERRRSGRLSDKPAPNYRGVMVTHTLEDMLLCSKSYNTTTTRRRIHSSSSSKRGR